jgi:acetyl esterase
MYFHGGGWVLGGADTHDRLLRELANGAHAAIVFVNYTLSPEAKYPVPVEQGYANFDTPSYNAYQDSYFLTGEAMKWFWDSYTSNQTNRKEPTVSPLQASIEQLKGLPPALIINGEFDVLRDEGEAYAHKLIEAGVPVTAVRYHGTIHDFVMLNPITDTPPVRGAILQASQMLKKILSD